MSQSNRISWLVISVTLLALTGILVQTALAEPAIRIDPNEVDAVDAAKTRDPVISNPSPYEPITKCKQCHIELTDQWISSGHATAYRNRVFRYYFSQYKDYVRYNWNRSTEIIDEQGRKRRVPKIPRFRGRDAASVVIKGQILEENQYDIKVKNPKEYAGIPCLKCHAPGAFYTGDEEPFKLENSKDGVFCDFCHTVIDYTDDLGFEIFPGMIKQGPRRTPVTGPHAIEFSYLFQKSVFCKPCHDDLYNNNGIKILDTYTEWYNSLWREAGTTCQDCHMAGYEGRSTKNGELRFDVADHSFYGVRDPEFLQTAADLDMESVIEGDNVNLTVTVTNSGVGHYLPSAWPLRQLVLIIRVKNADDETLWSDKRVYSRIYVDENNKITYNIWEPVAILDDTRLEPGEERVEEFTFPVPENPATSVITAQLFFRQLPEGDVVDIQDQPRPIRIKGLSTFVQE